MASFLTYLIVGSSGKYDLLLILFFYLDFVEVLTENCEELLIQCVK